LQFLVPAALVPKRFAAGKVTNILIFPAGADLGSGGEK